MVELKATKNKEPKHAPKTPQPPMQKRWISKPVEINPSLLRVVRGRKRVKGAKLKRLNLNALDEDGNDQVNDSKQQLQNHGEGIRKFL